MTKLNGRYVIVRGSKSGVFAGTLVDRRGDEVELSNCRRLWYWDGAASISQLAKSGTTRPNNCKFTVTVDSILIIGAIEVIPCTPEAETSIKAVSVWEK